MVEKISDVTAIPVTDVDVSSDEKDFLDFISKKKKEKKPEEMNDMAAVVLRHIPQLLDKSATQGGGMQSTETKVSVKTPQKQIQMLLDGSGDKARRDAILSAATTAKELTEVAGTKPTRGSEVVGTKPTRDSKVAAAPASVDKAVASTPMASAPVASAPVASAPVASAPVAAVSNAAIAVVGNDAKKAESEGSKVLAAPAKQRDGERRISDVAELHRAEGSAPVTQRTETSQPAETQTSARSEKTASQAMLQAAAANAATSESQSADLSYQFQRWSGDHSVKVSIPTDAKRDGNTTLQPSDARAAEALSRQMATMPAQSPELLQPKVMHNANLTDARRDGLTSAQLTDTRAFDGSSRMTAQSPEPAAELFRTRQDSEERGRQQQQRDSQDEEQE